MEPSESPAPAIEEHKKDLERQIDSALRAYEREHAGPLATEISFADDAPGGTAPEELKSRIWTSVDAFHRHAAVASAGIRVKKVTAMDSDADGTIAIKIEYDYPGYV